MRKVNRTMGSTKRLGRVLMTACAGILTTSQVANAQESATPAASAPAAQADAAPAAQTPAAQTQNVQTPASQSPAGQTPAPQAPRSPQARMYVGAPAGYRSATTWDLN